MMELAKGWPLIKLLKNQVGISPNSAVNFKANFSPSHRLEIALQVINAFQVVYQKGYLHRNIKPHNFNYDPRTNKMTVLDFGLSGKKD
jgi:serine/threonine protein kinase